MVDDTPVAASIASSWSRESHLIQTGRVAMGRSSARATAPSDRSIRRAVTSSQESIASPCTGATRSGSLRPVATAPRSTTFTSRGEATPNTALTTDFAVKYSGGLTMLSNNQCTLVNLHCISTGERGEAASCRFSSFVSIGVVLNCADGGVLTRCPPRRFSLLCPLLEWCVWRMQATGRGRVLSAIAGVKRLLRASIG